MKISNINLNLLKSFFLVYEHGSISKAADQLMLSPSAISQNIRELERQYSIKLFIPHSRGVTATKESDQLYRIVKNTFAQINIAETAMLEFDIHSTGLVKINCPSNIMTSVLLDYVDEFNCSYPNVRLEIIGNLKTEMYEELSKYNIDMIINTLPIDNYNYSFCVDKLMHLSKVLFASKEFCRKHNIIDGKLSKEHLKFLPLLLPSKFRYSTKTLLNALNIDVKTIIEISGGTEFMLGMVLRNKGIGYCTKEYLEYFNRKDIIILDIDVELPQSILAVAYNKDIVSRPVLAFIKGLKRFCSNVKAKTVLQDDFNTV